jgi:hypothetical protein
VRCEKYINYCEGRCVIMRSFCDYKAKHQGFITIFIFRAFEEEDSYLLAMTFRTPSASK